jgi:hypothetical protein
MHVFLWRSVRNATRCRHVDYETYVPNRRATQQLHSCAHDFNAIVFFVISPRYRAQTHTHTSRSYIHECSRNTHSQSHGVHQLLSYAPSVYNTWQSCVPSRSHFRRLVRGRRGSGLRKRASYYGRTYGRYRQRGCGYRYIVII